jgi:hypothetical protein
MPRPAQPAELFISHSALLIDNPPGSVKEICILPNPFSDIPDSHGSSTLIYGSLEVDILKSAAHYSIYEHYGEVRISRVVVVSSAKLQAA